MPRTIQIRDVPETLHRVLKARAASESMSLSAFLKRELHHIAERPSMREWLKRTHRAKPISTEQTAALAIRNSRDGR